MQFFNTLKRSIWPPQSYSSFLSRGSWFSWKYFLILHAIIVAIFCVMIIVPLAALPLDAKVREAVSVYPAELEVTYHKEGSISINQDLPYAIPMPAEWQSNLDESEEGENAPANLVIFDSEEDPSESSIFEYDTLVLVTEHTVQGIKDRGSNMEQANTYQIPEGEEDFVLTKAKVDDVTNAFLGHAFIRNKLYIPVLVLIIAPFFYLGLLALRIVMLAFFTFFTWLLAKIFFRGRSYSYGTLFQVSLHSITTILLISYVANLLGIHFFRGFVYFFAFLLWTMYIVSFLDAPHPHATHHVTHHAKTAKKTTTKKKKSS